MNRFFKRIDAAPVVEPMVDEKDTLTGEGIFPLKKARRVGIVFPQWRLFSLVREVYISPKYARNIEV